MATTDVGTWTGTRDGQSCGGYVTGLDSSAASARHAARMLCAHRVRWEHNGHIVIRDARGRKIKSEYKF